jgi:hypothetical protein
VISERQYMPNRSVAPGLAKSILVRSVRGVGPSDQKVLASLPGNSRSLSVCTRMGPCAPSARRTASPSGTSAKTRTLSVRTITDSGWPVVLPFAAFKKCSVCTWRLEITSSRVATILE